MQGKAAMIVGIFLVIVSLLIGVIGIGLLIGIGESENNAILAFLAVSLPFAVLAGLFAWIVPGYRWVIAIAMSFPVALISLMGSWSGGLMLLGAIWTVALTFLGAYSGGRLRLSSAGRRPEPPS